MIRILALFPLVSLAGCFDEPVACDLMLVYSVSVTVAAEDGAAIPDAVVTASLDGGEFAPCDSMGSDGAFACGMDVAGTFVVRAEAEGYDTVEQTVVVEGGECHVEAEVIALALSPVELACTEQVVPSVIATVVGASGEELTGVNVQWGYRDADMAPQPCSEQADATWQCGEEVAGDLEIYAAADGHGAPITSVLVEADECHVITEHVEIVVDWLPD